MPSPSVDFEKMEVRVTQTNIVGNRGRGLAVERKEGPMPVPDNPLSLELGKMSDSERMAYAMKMSYQSTVAVDDVKAVEKEPENPLAKMTEAEQIAYLMNMSAEDPAFEKRKSEEIQALHNMTDAERIAHVLNMTSSNASNEDVKEEVLVPPNLEKMSSEEQIQYALSMSANHNDASKPKFPPAPDDFQEPSCMICLMIENTAHVLNIKQHIDTYWTLYERVTTTYIEQINGRGFTFQYKGNDVDMDQFGTILADAGFQAGDEVTVKFM